MRDQVLDRWLADTYYHEFDAKTEAEAYRGVGVPRIRRRYRRCASQRGNALYFLTKTWYRGWAHGRPRRATTTLAVARRRLELRQALQRRHILVLGIPPPDARAALHSTRTKNHEAREAATRAAEVFLSRHLFIERHSGRVMNPEFLRLHYPLYHGYDNLGGLQAIAEIGRIDDPRCKKALDLLEAK